MSEEVEIDIAGVIDSILDLGPWKPEPERPFYGTDTRTILVTGDISESSCAYFCSKMLELERLDPEAPVYIHLNTLGGSIIDALAMYDTMRTTTCPIILEVRGLCASAGFLILSGADVRFALPNSLFFHHPTQMSEVDLSSPEHLKATTKIYDLLEERFNQILRTTCNISDEHWDTYFANAHALWFTTQQAMQWGILDGTIKTQEKASIQIEEEAGDGEEG